MDEFVAAKVNPGKVASPFELMQGAYTLAEMNQKAKILGGEAVKVGIETADMLATRQALADNTVQNPQTGMLDIDFKGTLNQLANISPTAAINFQLSMQQRQAELAEKQAVLQSTELANTTSKINLMGQLVQQVNSQEDLERVRKLAPKFGIDNNDIPDVYDSKVKDQLVSQSVKASDMLTHKLETQRLKLAATKQTAELSQMDASATNDVVGQYKDDPLTREYVKMTNTFTSFESMEASPEFSKGLKDRDLIYNFQNIINPDRSASGGTIEQDEETRGLLESMGVKVNKILAGDSLSPSQRQQISAFINEKYRQATLQQQAVFNQYQNRLLLLRSQGRNIDPYRSLPMYGKVVNHVPSVWGQYSKDLSVDRIAQDSAVIHAAGGKYSENTVPTFSMSEVESRAKVTGESIQDIVNAVKAKGGKVEGM